MGKEKTICRGEEGQKQEGKKEIWKERKRRKKTRDEMREVMERAEGEGNRDR